MLVKGRGCQVEPGYGFNPAHHCDLVAGRRLPNPGLWTRLRFPRRPRHHSYHHPNSLVARATVGFRGADAGARDKREADLPKVPRPPLLSQRAVDGRNQFFPAGPLVIGEVGCLMITGPVNKSLGQSIFGEVTNFGFENIDN